MLHVGDRVRMYRERALSGAEARNAGTLYVRRYKCVDCLPPVGTTTAR